jgi:hypothetical protein
VKWLARRIKSEAPAGEGHLHPRDPRGAADEHDLSRDGGVFTTTTQPPYSLLKIHHFVLKGDGVSWGVGTCHC